MGLRMYSSVRSTKEVHLNDTKIISIIVVVSILISSFIIYINIDIYNKNVYGSNTQDFLSNCARIAWKYYQPGIGVNPSTGLHYAKLSWHGFTDWDLAGYILTILDAGDIGLINVNGRWGVKYRLEKVLNFLANRKLSPDGIPYWAYSADSGNPINTKRLTTPSDSGRLLIALYKVKKKFPEYSNLVDYIVYNKTNYDKIASDSNLNWGSGFYLYYIVQGFKLFGFDKYQPVKRGLNEINRLMNGKFVNIYGINIPVTYVTSEPVIHGILDLNLGGDFRKLADRIYKVQELRYINIGKYTAFSEGANDRYPYYIYEWIVQGSPNKLWTVTYPTPSGLKNADIPPIIYTKIAISFLAIYNTQYAEKLAKYLASKTATQYGFYEGVDEDGRVITTITDKTNSMIINAVRYAHIHITKPSYKLTIKVLDWDGEDPIKNAVVYANNLKGITDENGVVVFNNLSGNITINIYYLGIPIASNISYFLSSNSNLTIKTDMFDLNIYLRGKKGESIVGANITLSLANKFSISLISDDDGYVRVNDIPIGSYNLSIYAGNSGILLKEDVINLVKDEETVYIYLDSCGNIKIVPNISVYM